MFFEEPSRQGCARFNQEKTHATEFALQSSTRMYAKQSAASTRGEAAATKANVTWPTKGPTS